MKLDFKFNQSNQSFNADFSEDTQSFKPNIGNFVTIYDGQNGATFTPHVSEDGVLSWTNDRELDNPQPVNIRGKDGKDGINGIDGVNGIDGKDGKDGKDGYTPIKGKDYFDGKNGVNGKDGTNGRDGYTPVKGVDYFDGKNGADGQPGKDGKTPVKGTDYFTAADKAEMVASVLAQLPVYNGEVISE